MANEMTNELTDFMLEQRAATEHALIKKVWADESLKQELLSDPKSVLAREMGIPSMPEGIEVTVIEEDATHLYLVIPQNPGEISQSDMEAEVDEELSEQALEGVAGGADNYVARVYSDVAAVYKTKTLPTSFLYGIKNISQINTTLRR